MDVQLYTLQNRAEGSCWSFVLLKLASNHRIFKPGGEDIIEIGKPERKLPLKSWVSALAIAMATGAVAYPMGVHRGYQAREDSRDLRPVQPRSAIANVLGDPYRELKTTKLAGTIASSVEVYCAHYAYQIVPAHEGTPIFIATDYQIYDSVNHVIGYIGAEYIRPNNPVPPCNDSAKFIQQLKDSIPNLEVALTPAQQDDSR